VVTAGNEE